MAKLTNESKQELNKIIEQLTSIANSEDDNTTKMLASILSMNDDEFDIMAPIFTNSFQQQLNHVNDKLVLIQALQLQGVKYEDLLSALNEISNLSIEDMNISQKKFDFILQLLGYIINAYGEVEGTSKRIVQIPTERVNEEVKFPFYATDGAAGADVYALEDVEIGPGETKIIPTGLKMEIPYGYAVLVQPRSGLSAKSKLRIANTPGLIDSDYRGEIGIILENIEPKIKDLVLDEEGRATGIEYGRSYSIGKGERIAQLRLVEVPKMAFLEVEKVSETTRNIGGYGSTGR